jgi:hypothetical protein
MCGLSTFFIDLYKISMAASLSRPDFMNDDNESMLNRIMVKDFQRRIGGNLNGTQRDRLERTVRYYMKQVVNNNPKKAIKGLNTDVLTAVVPDYLSYLRRNADTPENQDDSLVEDTNSRFDRIQSERQVAKPPSPPEPSFRLALDEPPAVVDFERIRRQREEETARLSDSSALLQGAAENNLDFVSADDEFRRGAQRATEKQARLLEDRQQQRQLTRGENTQLEIRPDRRDIFAAQQLQAQQQMQAQQMGYAQSATLALPGGVRDRPALPQDILKPQDSIVAYKEVEYNLFLNSADRDWANNTKENRYNFHVNFNPANNRPGENLGLSPAANIKFKNISRIELVKVYLPIEGADILLTKDVSNSFITDTNMNVLGFPYVHVRIPELDNNGFGTNNNLDNAFGVVSYDATWTADSGTKGKGFTRLIPKFLKAQKEYTPTPLATLQRLSIRLERPTGDLLATSADTLDISGFILSSLLTSYEGSPNKVTGTPYCDLSGYHIWIQTKTWFNQNLFAQGDQLLCRNLVFPDTFMSGTAAVQDFTQFLTQSQGQNIVDVGQVYYDGSRFVFTNTPNLAGYCNCIIIRNRFVDPTTGGTGLQHFGGTDDAVFMDELSTTQMDSGRIINLSNQSQIVFRIITREMDPASRIRPDNTTA